MCDSYVIIEQPDRKAIYVAVLTKEGTGAFWSELSKEIAQKTHVYENVTVAGNKRVKANTVKTSHTDEYSHCSLALEPVIDDMHFDIAVFNHYYQENSEYIINSRLTSIQKHVFQYILNVF